MKLNSLEELLREQLSDLYDAEQQLVSAIPRMQVTAQSPDLAIAFAEHLEQTKDHVKRLKQVFQIIDEKPLRKSCKAMKGLVEEAGEILKVETPNRSVLDAALIAAAQRVEHYEIACYGAARTYAHLLNYPDAVVLLQRTLDEEGGADSKLSEIAESINVQAVEALELVAAQ